MLWQTLCIIFAIFIIGKLLAFLGKFIRMRSAIKKLPCPPGVRWFTGHQKVGHRDPGGFQWLRDTVKAYPRTYILWRGLFPVPNMVHPDTVKPLMSDSVPNIRFEVGDVFEDWIGKGLLTSNGAKWKRNRRLLTRSFHLDVLRTYVPVYNDCVEVLLGKMDKLAAEGKPMSINRELALCTFDVFLRTACSYKSNCQLKDSPKEGELDVLSATGAMFSILQERFMSLLLIHPWIFKFTSLYTKYTRARDYLRDFAKQLIEQRQKEIAVKMDGGNPITKPRDFLDTLLLARDADGGGLTFKEIQDEVNTFLLAGYETTATSLTWLLYSLAKYPEHQTKIRQEVDEILEDRDSDRITSDDFSSMKYMTLVIKESMRMNNASVEIGRTLLAPMTVDGVTLPAGTPVGINIYQLHHNPAVWGDDHMEFKPSRFLPENFTKMDPFAYVPFSAGSRNCIGQQFALNKIKVVLARILRRFRLSLVEGEPEPVQCVNLVLKTQNELLLAIEPINMKS